MKLTSQKSCAERHFRLGHNIDAEEIMGMFSVGKERAKSANVDFLAGRIRSRKNKVIPWLGDMYQEKRESIVISDLGNWES